MEIKLITTNYQYEQIEYLSIKKIINHHLECKRLYILSKDNEERVFRFENELVKEKMVLGILNENIKHINYTPFKNIKYFDIVLKGE